MTHLLDAPGTMKDAQPTEFLVVGAGPYGLATAAYAKSLGLDVTVVGRPLDFWKTHMPRGMLLRSGPDWHLDARAVATFEAYVRLRGLRPADIKPLRLHTFFEYVGWFMGQYELVPQNAHVVHFARSNGEYLALLDDGSRVRAKKASLGLGFAFFKHCPADITRKLPPGSFAHTCDTVDLDRYRGKRVLIIGGRQSAFEWAALIRECGGEEIHMMYRHSTPRLAEPDWSWVQPMARRALKEHAWWRWLSAEEQERIRADFWMTGRLVLEQGLAERIDYPNIHLHPRTGIVSVDACRSGTYDFLLDDGSTGNVHHIILATGYLPVMDNVTFLDRVSILGPLATACGFPVLDPEFQTSLRNLYVTALAATRDFGPFFGFTVGCPVAASIIGQAATN